MRNFPLEGSAMRASLTSILLFLFLFFFFCFFRPRNLALHNTVCHRKRQLNPSSTSRVRIPPQQSRSRPTVERVVYENEGIVTYYPTRAPGVWPGVTDRACSTATLGMRSLGYALLDLFICCIVVYVLYTPVVLYNTLEMSSTYLASPPPLEFDSRRS
ncbi:hypothetical protein F5Y11DRAFT_149831 [Daldinia sp. FL1419]|nr:hypothetical protein F5Y11DRAFT_149831 [Daldinia sp. FL1419]